MQIFHWGTDGILACSWSFSLNRPNVFPHSDHVVCTWLHFDGKNAHSASERVHDPPAESDDWFRSRNCEKSRTEPANQIQILFVQCSHIALWLHSSGFHFISNSISVKSRKRRSFERLLSLFKFYANSSFLLQREKTVKMSLWAECWRDFFSAQPDTFKAAKWRVADPFHFRATLGALKGCAPPKGRRLVKKVDG
jgi:hypothetical protein